MVGQSGVFTNWGYLSFSPSSLPPSPFSLPPSLPLLSAFLNHSVEPQIQEQLEAAKDTDLGEVVSSLHYNIAENMEVNIVSLFSEFG